jgi:hypothetical protein
VSRVDVIVASGDRSQVPELTRFSCIKLNVRLQLRYRKRAVGWPAPDISRIRTQRGEPSVDHTPLGGFVPYNSTELLIMSTPNPILKEDDLFERRSKGRTIINRDALLFFTGQHDVFPCRVRDATNAGAGIMLNGLNIVPSEFGISFDRFRTMRRCRLVWRDGDFVGGRFES